MLDPSRPGEPQPRASTQVVEGETHTHRRALDRARPLEHRAQSAHLAPRHHARHTHNTHHARSRSRAHTTAYRSRECPLASRTVRPVSSHPVDSSCRQYSTRLGSRHHTTNAGRLVVMLSHRESTRPSVGASEAESVERHRTPSPRPRSHDPETLGGTTDDRLLMTHPIVGSRCPSSVATDREAHQLDSTQEYPVPVRT